MQAIKEFLLMNLQSHKNTVIVLPETGLVRFVGENSNGKSVLPKVLSATISCTLNRKELRDSLIRRGESQGLFMIRKYNDDYLKVNIHRESAKTFYELRIGENIIKRYISDKNLNELIELFGFHYNSKRNISLNNYETNTPLLMVSNSDVENWDILDEAMADTRGQNAAECLRENKKELEEIKKKLTEQISRDRAVLASCVLYNLEKQETIQMRAKNYISAINKMMCSKLPEVKRPMDINSIKRLSIPNLPNIKTLDCNTQIETIKLLNTYKLPSIKPEINKGILLNWKVLDFNTELENIKQIADRHFTAKDSLSKCICPTCKRKWVSTC